MRLQRRAVLAVVGAVVLAAVFMPGRAQAQELPTITVTPDRGLVDGQVVEVSGTGFEPDRPIGPFPGDGSETIVFVCPSWLLDFEPFDTTELIAMLSLCGALAVEASTDATGVLSGTVQVAKVMPTVSSGNVVECGIEPNDCFVFAGSLGTNVRFSFLDRYATAFISFGPPTPQTKAECKNGGWRNLANDQGQPFRNQGGCVSWVASQK